MTIKIEIWSTNIHSLRFGNIRECVTLWKVILQSLGCPWNFITPQLNTLTWFLCQPSEMYRMNVRKLWLLPVMQSRHTCTVLQFNSNLVNSNIYLSHQVPQEDLWQLRCSISPHIYGKLPHSIIWRHTKKKKRKNNANIRYRHECEPISLYWSQRHTYEAPIDFGCGMSMLCPCLLMLLLCSISPTSPRDPFSASRSQSHEGVSPYVLCRIYVFGGQLQSEICRHVLWNIREGKNVDTKSRIKLVQLDFLYKVINFVWVFLKAKTLDKLHKMEMTLVCLEIMKTYLFHEDL